MRALKWSASVAVFVTDIDDQHREIFEAISNLRKAITLSGPSLEIRKLTEHLVTSLSEHFAHEERLMHAARYGSLRWHKEKHNAARRRVRQFVQRMGQGDSEAGPELVDYLSGWLPDHALLPDRMMGAFLRNRQRGLCKVTFRSGTKPVDACDWVDVNGEPINLRIRDDGS